MSILRSPERLLALCLAAVMPAGAAQETEAAQRERIARQRALIESDARAGQQACAQHFAVTDCIDRVKAERRQRLQPLDRESAALDDEVRKRRAAERLAQIQRRQASGVEAKPEVAVRSRKPSASEASASATEREGAERADAAARQATAAQAEADAARRAAASARRAQEAEEHRLAVEKRNQERARRATPSQPLPTPPAASR